MTRPFTIRPYPTAADIEAAKAFVAEVYERDPEVSRGWLANHRRDLIRYAADAAMQKRQLGEHLEGGR